MPNLAGVNQRLIKVSLRTCIYDCNLESMRRRVSSGFLVTVHAGKQRSLKGNGRSKRHAPSAVSVLELLNFDGGKQALTDSE